MVVGRAIAGLTSANMAVGSAYIADITAEKDRASRYGLMGAIMGVGFIIGPVLGGVLGAWWLRAPFLAAAVLNGLNLLLALFVLPETRKPRRRPGSTGRRSIPWRRWCGCGTSGRCCRWSSIFVVFGLIAAVPGTIWVLYGADRFGWDPVAIGAVAVDVRPLRWPCRRRCSSGPFPSASAIWAR